MKFTSVLNRGLRFTFLFAAALTILATSCKKSSKNSDLAIKNLAFDESKKYYLWTDNLPSKSDFNPGALNDIHAVLNKLRTYSDKLTDGKPQDKWSFAETKEETALSQEGSAKDFGFMIKFDTNNQLRVIYVYDKSASGLAGIKRTWILNSIDGRLISRDNAGSIDYVNKVFFNDDVTTATFGFINDGSPVSIKLTKPEKYTPNTILYSNVYPKGEKKIGYFVFNEFGPETSMEELTKVFNNFQIQGVNEIIIDLRYNRGGFVKTQDMLANILAPTNVGTNQKIMYRLVNNKYNSSEDFTEYFKKSGSLNLSRIFFIVSPSSASASELLINNLKGIDGFNVILIGDTRTYGKPVGFFPIPVFEYNIFPVSFKTVNSKGQADFYSGFPVDKNVQDDLLRDFGDENEANLKQALNFITSGSFLAISADRISSVSTADIQRTKEINAQIAEHLPSATIEDRPSRMPESIRRLQR